jgi:hypothetical protein
MLLETTLSMQRHMQEVLRDDLLRKLESKDAQEQAAARPPDAEHAQSVVNAIALACT